MYDIVDGRTQETSLRVRSGRAIEFAADMFVQSLGCNGPAETASKITSAELPTLVARLANSHLESHKAAADFGYSLADWWVSVTPRGGWHSARS